MDSYDAFYNSCKRESDNHVQLKILLVICLTYFIIMLSLIYRINWWSEHHIITGVLGIIYFLYVCTTGISLRTNLLKSIVTRFQQWSEYTESSNSTYYTFAPFISNGDYLYITDGKNGKYLKLYFDSYRLKLSEIKSGDNVYSIDNGRINRLDDLLRDLESMLRKEGKEIRSIYNKYGDVKWHMSGINRPPSNTKKYIYKVGVILWEIACIIVALAPIYGIDICYRGFK